MLKNPEAVKKKITEFDNNVKFGKNTNGVILRSWKQLKAIKRLI